MEDKVYYGWYSSEQAEWGGKSAYKTPDGKGIVEVTEVSANPEHKSKSPDAVYIGKLGPFVNRLGWGIFGNNPLC